MKKNLLNLSFVILLLSAGYSQYDETNGEDYYPERQDCYLNGANLTGVDFSYANLDGILNVIDVVIYINSNLNGE